jgi:protein-disulfide isomerase
MHSAQTSTICNLIILLALASALNAQVDSLKQPQRQPLARIGEQAVYEEDLLPLIGGQLLQLKNQEYELKMKALLSLVNQRLLDGEAKSKGLPREQVLEEMVDRKLPPSTPSEVEAYYLAQKDRINRPFEEVKGQVEGALTQAKRQQARQNYTDRLYRDASVSILLTRPKVEINADPLRLRGGSDAPVTIVEFADFQCPYCQNAQELLKGLIKKYEGRVRLGFRDFPLRQIHPQAEQAAEAARCAGEQGKFWEYHDLLYGNQSRLDPDSLREHARTAGLDTESFRACLASTKFVVPVESDLQAGIAAGVSATPTFYINGIALVGLQPASAFESIIESELADAASKQRAR